MPNNNGSFITWKQIPVIIGLLMLFIVGGGYVYTKADKTEVRITEARCEKRIDKVEKRLEEDIKEIKAKQGKMYDLLLSIKTITIYPKHPVGNPIGK